MSVFSFRDIYNAVRLLMVAFLLMTAAIVWNGNVEVATAILLVLCGGVFALLIIVSILFDAPKGKG